MFAIDPEELRSAIAAGDIEPYFQPLVELRTGQLCGYEVLARWSRADGEVVLPELFVRIAEESGLIGVLMDCVLSRAFRACLKLPSHLRLAVNVSPFQLRDYSLVRQLQELAAESEFLVSRLTVEITESALVGNVDHARGVMEDLKALGVRLALDDFGTGYSSLRHLHGLPFDELKIDRSFVETMMERRESRKIVASVVGLGQSLGLATVAEGIEHQEQAEMLVWMGCDQGQGWLYGGALPACELATPGREPRWRGTGTLQPGFSEWAKLTETLPLQRSAQLQAIYDGAPVGLCYLDRSLRYVSVNRRLSEMNHVPIAAHLGRTVQEVRSKLYRSIEPYLKRALTGEAIVGLELQLLPENSDEPGPMVMLSYFPARDEAGEVVGISVCVMDVTQRETAQRALKESEDNYRYTMELSPQVPWMADAEGKILDANAKWEGLTGQPIRQALGFGWCKSVHPEDLPGVLEAWRSSLASGSPVDSEFRVGRGNGTWRWVRSRAAARRNKEGKTLRWYGTLEDIDEHRREQQELIKSRAMLQAVFEAVPVGIVIAEASTGRVLMGNPKAEEIMGHPMRPTPDFEAHENWVVRRKDGSRLHKEEYPLVRAILNGEMVGPEEYEYERPDGSRVRLSLTAAPVRGAQGEVTGGVVAIRNVDENLRG